MVLILPHLQQKGCLNDIDFTICVVGSRQFYKEVNHNPWSALAPNLTIYGFDADPEACEIANQALRSQPLNYVETHIPQAIAGTVGEATLYVTKGVHCSSLYPPNTELVRRLNGYCQELEVDFAVQTETTTLDHWAEQNQIQQVDVLQIDVQGADLDVLRGAPTLIRSGVLAIEIEVEFSPIYQNQPLFADIDIFLRNCGFSLFDLNMRGPWCRQPRSSSPIHSNQRPGQLLWADALYLRDLVPANFSPSELRTPTHLLRLACLADTLGWIDYALEILECLTITFGDDPRYNLATEISSILSQLPGLNPEQVKDLPIIQRLTPWMKS